MAGFAATTEAEAGARLNSPPWGDAKVLDELVELLGTYFKGPPIIDQQTVLLVLHVGVVQVVFGDRVVNLSENQLLG